MCLYLIFVCILWSAAECVLQKFWVIFWTTDVNTSRYRTQLVITFMAKWYAIIVNILIFTRFWWYSQIYQYITLRTWYDSYFCILSIWLCSVVFSCYIVYVSYCKACIWCQSVLWYTNECWFNFAVCWVKCVLFCLIYGRVAPTFTRTYRQVKYW